MRRSGIVLVFALLAIVLLELLALSALGFARMAQAASRATVETMSLRRAAEGAALSVAAGLFASAAAARLRGATLQVPVSSVGGIDVSAQVETLRDGYQLVQARAQPVRGAPVNALVLVRVMTADALHAGFPAALSTHSTGGGTPAASSVEPSACGASGRPPPMLPLQRLLEPDDTLPFGPVVGVSWGDVRRIADATAPAYDAPPALVHLTGPLALTGPIAGVIAVDGNLELAPGAAVRGLLTVRGTLTVHDGAVVEGAVRARAIAAGGAHIRPDPCAVITALDAPALRRVYRPGPRWLLPAF